MRSFIYLKRLIVIVLIIIAVCENIFSQSKAGYHIINGVELNKTYCSNLVKLVIILPIAQTNQYQTVTNSNYYNGLLINIPNTDDMYVRFTFWQADLQNFDNIFQIFYDFDITLNSVYFDFNQITEIFPYDTTSNNYLWYTGSSGVYVVPSNPVIQSIGDSIWSQSSDIVDYAEKCYEYVAENFNYLNPFTGLHPLSDILAAGGGDCGNLSSIFVSLLRYKNIPSRHIVTVRPDGSYHVWADFYLENYGWIPVDVTYKLFYPPGNYFGNYDGNGIVFTKEVWLLLQRDNAYHYYTPLLQNYEWWYWWGSGGCTLFTSHHYFISGILSANEKTCESQISIYPNPAYEHLRLTIPLHLNDLHVEIYSTTGVLLYSNKLNGEKVIDISGLKSGLHIMRLHSDTVSVIRKFVKK